MRRVVRWLAYAVFGLIVLLLVGFGVLFAFNRDGALLLADALLGEFVNNQRPPPLAEGLIIDSDWLHTESASARITGKLRKSFPVASKESSLRSVLMSQGFVPDRPPAKDCVTDETKVPVGKVFQICPDYDWHRSMQYDWGNVPCDEYVTVRWSADRHGRITQVAGYYGTACL